MSARFELSAEDFDRLMEAIKSFPGDAEKVINDVLHGYGADTIMDRVKKFMPVSDKKKGTHAVDAASLRHMDTNLATTVHTTNKYHYLYFPDDGTNTRKHVGNQQFFLRGAEDAAGEIVATCQEKLTQTFEEGV